MMIGRNDLCWCGSKKKWKHCHYPELGSGPFSSSNEERQEELKSLYFRKYKIILKTQREIEGIRSACKLTSEILDKTCTMAQEGITTLELNDFAHQLHLDAGAIPAPLHYGSPPFPKSICTSINDVICHGIPDKTKLRQGDIVNIDLSCYLNGYYGDCSRMVMIGNVNPERRRVVDTAYECLMKSIEPLKPGLPLYIIGETIEAHAKKRQCSVVYQFVGHGIGIDFHEAPQIPHHRNAISIPLAAGMIFTIEPMINAGVADAIIDPYDQWTARTKDKKPSAQWEHTILITDTGHEILTPWKWTKEPEAQ